MKLPHGGINIQYASYNLGYHPGTIRILTHTYFFKPHTSQAFNGHMVSVTVDVEMSELKRGLHGLLVGPMDHAIVYVFVIRF